MDNEEMQKQALSMAQNRLVSSSGDFTQNLVAGVEFPPHVRAYLYGLDEEIQLSNLPTLALDYIVSAVTYIMELRDLHLKSRNPEEQELFLKWIDETNSEIKTIVRGFRGEKGFTMTMLQTFFYRVFQTPPEGERKRGVLSDLWANFKPAK